MNKSLVPLWGTTLRRLEVDLLSRRVCLTIESPGEGASEWYELELTGVLEIHFTSQVEWDYIEVTEARIERQSDGTLKIELLLWVEESWLVLVSRRARLNQEYLLE